MNYTKTYFKNRRTVKLSIDIVKIAEGRFRIKAFYHSRNNKDFVSHGETLKNNHLIYVVPKTFGKDSKLLFNNKIVKHYEVGSLTCFYIDDNHVIPCSLIDEAIDKLK